MCHSHHILCHCRCGVVYEYHMWENCCPQIRRSPAGNSWLKLCLFSCCLIIYVAQLTPREPNQRNTHKTPVINCMTTQHTRRIHVHTQQCNLCSVEASKARINRFYRFKAVVRQQCCQTLIKAARNHFKIGLLKNNTELFNWFNFNK